jgi:single-stranded DNA-specific DHH superfamily exonuclease
MLSQFRLEQRAKSISKLIENSKNPIMFFDADTDGGTSYLQLKNAFPQIKGFYMPKNFDKQYMQANLVAKSDLVIFFDIPILREDFLTKVIENGGQKMVWVDHHPSNDIRTIKKYKIINLNPLNYNKKDNRASSYLAYLVSGKKKENLKYVVLGTVADFFLLNVIIDFYNEDKINFKLLINISDAKREELFNFLKSNKYNSPKSKQEREKWIRYLNYETNLGLVKNFIDFIYKLEETEKVSKAFKIIEKLSLADLIGEINSGKNWPFDENLKMKKKYNIFLKDAMKLKDEELIIYEGEGSTPFTKTISEEMCYRFKKWKMIVACFKKTDSDEYRCSLRGNGIEVNKLVDRALEGLNGYGGGHPFAAGATVKNKDFNQFKSNLKKEFENLRNSN